MTRPKPKKDHALEFDMPAEDGQCPQRLRTKQQPDAQSDENGTENQRANDAPVQNPVVQILWNGEGGKIARKTKRLSTARDFSRA